MSNWRLMLPVSFSVVIISFAVNSVITRHLVSTGLVDPLPLTLIRFLSGLLTLALLAYSSPARFTREKMGRRDIGGALFLGLYAFSISYGYLFIPASAGALVFYSAVVLIMSAYSVIFDREPLSIRLLASQVLGIGGILVVTFRGVDSGSIPGAALMALTGLSWGLYSVTGRKTDSYFSYTYNSFLLLGLAGSVLIPVSAYFSGVQLWTEVSPPSLALALYMGMVSTALSYILWNAVLKRVSASQGGLTQLMVPVVTAVMGVAFLSEKVSLETGIGGVLIIAGIYVNNSRTRNSNSVQR